MLLEVFQEFPAHAFDVFVAFFSEELEIPVSDEGNVFFSAAQGGQGDGEDVAAVEKGFSEFAFCPTGLQVAVGMGDDPYIYPGGFAVSSSDYFLSFTDTNHL